MLGDVVMENLLFISGKEVVLLMQALNSLATPEEKLAALCKKYADSVRLLLPPSLSSRLGSGFQ